MGYRIRVPEEAWAMLPRHAFPVTLRTCALAEDGQLCVKVVTLGGSEMDFELAADSPVQALMRLIADKLQLGASIVVKVVIGDETVLDPDAVLQVVVVG